jgi:tetratricopeptide (TPR) repeat protein
MGGSSAERFRRADAVFDAALDLAGDDRQAFVERACAGDPELRADVERLLRSHHRSDGFLSTPAAHVAGPLMANAPPAGDGGLTTLPDHIGPYRIEREIGRGGMGVVYLAERDDPNFRQRVALKVVRDGAPDGRAHVARFLAERRLLASLEHRHIARLFDGGVTADGLPYYTMAFCEGGSLAERLRAEGALPVRDALRIARELATALGAAHARGIVHRDVKPANVLFDAQGSVRLSDFGVAKLVGDDITRSGAVLGTVAYLAPEQVRGEAIDHRTDLWALGVTLYEMLGGRRPFGGPSYAAVMHAIVALEPDPLRQHVPGIPSAVDALVMRLLEKDPASRPASAEEVVQAIDGGLVGGAVPARNTRPTAFPPAAPARRRAWQRRRVSGVAIGALGLLGMAGGYVAWGRYAGTAPGPSLAPLLPAATAPLSSTDSAAASLYERGRFALKARTGPADLRRAEAYFKEAVARDSTYARAYAGLSDMYTSMLVFGYERPEAASAKARTYAERALTLDSTLAEAHTSLGHTLCTHDYDWPGGERELRRAIAQDPNYTFGRTVLAICLLSQARFDEAAAQLKIAASRDRVNFAVDAVLGRVYVSSGRADDAIRVLTQTTQLNPQADLAWEQLGHAYLLKGMHREGIAALDTAARLSGVRDSAQLAYAYAIAGDRTTARRIVRALLASQRRRYLPPFHIAMAYAGLGQTDDAFRWLDTAFTERASFMNGVMVEPGFTSLHGDPRWRLLLARMGLDRARR